MSKLIFLLLSLCFIKNVNAQQSQLLIGTYTNKGNSEGIYVYDFNAKTGSATLKNSAKTTNPSYLAIDKTNTIVFAVNENGQNSSVTSFSFIPESGSLNEIDTKKTSGADPCFVTINGHQILIANYSGGSLDIFNSTANGKFLDKKQVIQHTGKSVDATRQKSAHVHQVQLTPDQKFVIVNDLGEDFIYIYQLPKTANKELTLYKKIKMAPGSGPRHLSFSTNGKFAYLTHEFNGKITAFKYAMGNLTKIQEVETAPLNFKGKIDAADIHVSPDGKYLYQTNRGDLNTISLFAIAKDGQLNFVETISTLGKGPRNFAIDPSGKFLLVAHQYTNDVVIFNRDQHTGKLTANGKKINVGAPVCLVFSK